MEDISTAMVRNFLEEEEELKSPIKISQFSLKDDENLQITL